MMGQQQKTESLFYYFRLEDHIPENHLVRLIDRYVDFSFVRERLKDFYSQVGRPSIEHIGSWHRTCGRRKGRTGLQPGIYTSTPRSLQLTTFSWTIA